MTKESEATQETGDGAGGKRPRGRPRKDAGAKKEEGMLERFLCKDSDPFAKRGLVARSPALGGRRPSGEEKEDDEDVDDPGNCEEEKDAGAEPKGNESGGRENEEIICVVDEAEGKKRHENNIPADLNNNDGTSDYEEETRVSIVTWMTELEGAERKMLRAARNMVLESERRMKEWWKIQLAEIKENMDAGDDARGEGQCECCAEWKREHEEQTIRFEILRDQREEERRRWEQERQKLVEVIDRLTGAKEKLSASGENTGIFGSECSTQREGTGRKTVNLSPPELGANGQKGESSNSNREAQRKDRGEHPDANLNWSDISDKELGFYVERENRQGKGLDEKNGGRKSQELDKGSGNIVKQPGRMNQIEWREELDERRRRKRNVRIRRLKLTTKGLKNDVVEAIQDRTGVTPFIRNIKRAEEGLVVELATVQNKIDIVRKSRLKRWGDVEITDDTTKREQEIQAWIENLAKEKRSRGEEVRTGYMKLWYNGEWKSWNDLEGELITEAEINRNGSATRRRAEGDNGFRAERRPYGTRHWGYGY